MLQSLVQGVTHIEVFTPQLLESLRNCAVSGSASRVFDKACKCFVLALYNTASLEIPRKARESLAILQPYLVVQCYIPRGKTFTIEVSFIDHSNTKRRLVFTHCRDIVRHQLHVRLPNDSFKRDTWVNLCFDVVDFATLCFPGQTYKHLDQIRITAVCRVRRVFTMKARLRDTTGEEEGETYYYDIVPPTCDLPRQIPCVSQMLTARKLLPEMRKPLYYSSSPPKVNRKLYRGYKRDTSNIFRPRKSDSSVTDPIKAPTLPRITPAVQVLEPPPRLELPHESSDEYVEEVLERHSPSPDRLKEEPQRKLSSGSSSLPDFFSASLQHATEVRHFTPPFVNVALDRSLPRYRYDAKSRAYETGLEEVKE